MVGVAILRKLAKIARASKRDSPDECEVRKNVGAVLDGWGLPAKKESSAKPPKAAPHDDVVALAAAAAAAAVASLDWEPLLIKSERSEALRVPGTWGTPT